MITMTTAYSFEVHDAESAVRDILGQLDLGALPKNSVGLVFCNLEFVESSVLEAVCAALPFETVGCTTQGAAVRGAMGHLMLALAVLSGDGAVFSTSLSEPLAEDPDSRIAASFRNAASKLGGASEEPSMMFAFQPYLRNIRGDTVLRALDAESGGVPVFGTMALDFTTEFRSPMTFLNGKAYGDRLPLLLLSGETKPLFLTESLPEGRATIRQNDIVTDARDNILISVNNAPAYDYMEKLGLARNGAFDGTQLSLPVLLDHHNGEKPQACSFYEMTPEGHVRCDGGIPVGAAFSIGSLGHGDVTATAAGLAEEALSRKESGPGGLILFSCFSRNIVLAGRSAEMETIRDRMARSSLPYLFIHSGGELCPLYDDSQKTANRFHNYSLIGCLL